METATPFSPAITPELCDDASRVFVRSYLARKYGTWIVVGDFCNVASIAAAWSMGADSILVASWALLAVVLPTLHFTVFWFRRPARFSAQMQRTFDPSTLYSIGVEGLTFTLGDRSVSIAWTRVKAVLERPAYFLLVLSPFSFLVVPTATLPAQGEALLRERLAPAKA